MSTCSVKAVPGRRTVPVSLLVMVAVGTKRFHFGQVDVSRRVERTSCGGADMVFVARTVKAGKGWAAQWGVGRAGVMRVEVVVEGLRGAGGGGGVGDVMELGSQIR